MKSTKTIEIMRCDVCSTESGYLEKCATCKKEVCGKCREPFTAFGYKRGSSPSYDGTFCGTCVGRMILALLEIGFIVRPAQPYEPCSNIPETDTVEKLTAVHACDNA